MLRVEGISLYQLHPITNQYWKLLKILLHVFVPHVTSPQSGASSFDNSEAPQTTSVLRFQCSFERRDRECKDAAQKKMFEKIWCKTPGNCVVANGESKDELPIHPFLAAPCPAFDSINQCLTANWWNCTSVHEIPRIQTEYVLKMSETFWLFLTRSRHMSA